MSVSATAIDAVAEAWASIDGKYERYMADKNGKAPENDGSYQGYQVEAAELIRRLHTRGFKLTRLPRL